jgi:hypothetical protein
MAQELLNRLSGQLRETSGDPETPGDSEEA